MAEAKDRIIGYAHSIILILSTALNAGSIAANIVVWQHVRNVTMNGIKPRWRPYLLKPSKGGLVITALRNKGRANARHGSGNDACSAQGRN